MWPRRTCLIRNKWTWRAHNNIIITSGFIRLKRYDIMQWRITGKQLKILLIRLNLTKTKNSVVTDCSNSYSRLQVTSIKTMYRRTTCIDTLNSAAIAGAVDLNRRAQHIFFRFVNGRSCVVIVYLFVLTTIWNCSAEYNALKTAVANLHLIAVYAMFLRQITLSNRSSHNW